MAHQDEAARCTFPNCGALEFAVRCAREGCEVCACADHEAESMPYCNCEEYHCQDHTLGVCEECETPFHSEECRVFMSDTSCACLTCNRGAPEDFD